MTLEIYIIKTIIHIQLNILFSLFQKYLPFETQCSGKSNVEKKHTIEFIEK